MYSVKLISFENPVTYRDNIIGQEVQSSFHRKRMSITEVIHTLYREKGFRRPILTGNAAKKALEETAWADVGIPV